MTAKTIPGPAGGRFLRLFLTASLAFGMLASLFVALFDPFGISPLRLSRHPALMDVNQRYMYPQVARSRHYDSAVFGTSTARLLDPKALDATFGGQFANLAMNAATPWEQLQLARLFVREAPAPRLIVMGLDNTWCEADADRKKLTFRAFPESFYDDNRWNDLSHLFSLRSVEIAGRVAAWRMGKAVPRIRADGYDNFLPPESQWTLDGARRHLWGNAKPEIEPVSPPVLLDAATAATLPLPAIDWLGAFLRERPAGAQIVLFLPPVHVSAQPRPGSREAAIRQACTARITGLARQNGAVVIDMAFPNAVTRDDARYWDPLHYRLPIAEGLPGQLAEALAAKSPEAALWRRPDLAPVN